MDAIVLDKLGQAPKVATFGEPVAQDGEAVVSVTAASIKPLDRGIAKGIHYASPKELPVVCGTDGVGYLADGMRVFFWASRQPFGGMAERSIASWWVPVPEAVSDAQAAALINPALGSWLPVVWRAKMQPGETVLVLGATGGSGQLAVKIARIVGAGRIVAAGRNQAELAKLGADAIVDTTLPHAELVKALAEAAGADGYDVVIDYLWGAPAEAAIETLTETGLGVSHRGAERGIRFVSVGELAGRTISLPSGVLRSSHLHILGSGSGNFPPQSELKCVVQRILEEAEKGHLFVETETMDMERFAALWDASAKMAVRPVMILPRR